MSADDAAASPIRPACLAGFSTPTSPTTEKIADTKQGLYAAAAFDPTYCKASRTIERSMDSPRIVPVVLLLAAYTVHLYPEKTTVVLLVLAALAAFGPTAAPVHRLMADTFEQVARRTAGSPELHELAMRGVLSTLEDSRVKHAFVESCTASMLESMTNERSQAVMVSCMTKSAAAATAEAVQDQQLHDTLNTAMRSGVKEALSDSTVVGTFFDVVREGLRDPKMHQAALKGAVNAANPLKDLSVPTFKDFKNPLKDVPDLKALKSTVKDAMVDVEAKSLSNASGLSRAPPPSVQAAKTSGSPVLGPSNE